MGIGGEGDLNFWLFRDRLGVLLGDATMLVAGGGGVVSRVAERSEVKLEVLARACRMEIRGEGSSTLFARQRT